MKIQLSPETQALLDNLINEAINEVLGKGLDHKDASDLNEVLSK
jgi:hypothetical protein